MTAQAPAADAGAPAVSRRSEGDGWSEGSVRRPGKKHAGRNDLQVDLVEGHNSGLDAGDGKRRRRCETGHARFAGGPLRTALPVVAAAHGVMIDDHAAGFHWTRRRCRHGMRRRRRDNRQGQRGGPDQDQGQEADQVGSPHRRDLSHPLGQAMMQSIIG